MFWEECGFGVEEDGAQLIVSVTGSVFSEKGHLVSVLMCVFVALCESDHLGLSAILLTSPRSLLGSHSTTGPGLGLGNTRTRLPLGGPQVARGGGSSHCTSSRFLTISSRSAWFARACDTCKCLKL